MSSFAINLFPCQVAHTRRLSRSIVRLDLGQPGPALRQSGLPLRVTFPEADGSLPPLDGQLPVDVRERPRGPQPAPDR
jgi:NADPH-dependent ferric siderophore reductase